MHLRRACVKRSEIGPNRGGAVNQGEGKNAAKAICGAIGYNAFRSGGYANKRAERRRK